MTAARVLQLLEMPVLVAVPLVLGVCACWSIDQAALLSILVVVLAVLVFMGGWEAEKPSLRQVMPTVVLGALAAAGRVMFAPIPDFKPVSAICIIAGVVFGRKSGFMVGVLAALVSNFFFGQGAWTPWQMYSWGLLGYLAGVLNDHGVFERFPKLLYVYGLFSPLLYGLFLNGWYIVGYVRPLEPETVLMAFALGLPLDAVHCVATLFFLLLLYAPCRRKLLRIRRKFDLRYG